MKFVLQVFIRGQAYGVQLLMSKQEAEGIVVRWHKGEYKQMKVTHLYGITLDGATYAFAVEDIVGLVAVPYREPTEGTPARPPVYPVTSGRN